MKYLYALIAFIAIAALTGHYGQDFGYWWGALMGVCMFATPWVIIKYGKNP
jgi:ABC-type polysaccharide/polyol phosphate export permease